MSIEHTLLHIYKLARLREYDLKETDVVKLTLTRKLETIGNYYPGMVFEEIINPTKLVWELAWECPQQTALHVLQFQNENLETLVELALEKLIQYHSYTDQEQFLNFTPSQKLIRKQVYTAALKYLTTLKNKQACHE